MKTSTTISDSIDATAGQVQCDTSCKQLLAERIILAWIMKGTMPEYASLPAREIADHYILDTPQISEIPVFPNVRHPSESSSSVSRPPKIQSVGTEDTTVDEGTTLFDIRFHTLLPSAHKRITVVMNLEAQGKYYPGYPLLKRAMYYCSRMISSQYGTIFLNSHYEKIKKVYSIWICLNPPKKRQNTINRYRMQEQQLFGTNRAHTAHYDLLTAVLVCIGDPDAEGTPQLLRLLDVLFSPDMHTAVKKEILTREFEIPMTQNFERRLQDMCNFSEGFWQKGWKEGRKRGRQEGHQEGRQEGRKEGRRKGRQEGISDSLRNLMDTLHVTPGQAMDLLLIEERERKKYHRLLHSRK